MAREERIAQNPQWWQDYDFLAKRLFEFKQEDMPRIRQIIESYPGKFSENKDMRGRAYLVLVRHLRQFPDPDYIRWHIAQIPKETDKYILGNMMDEIRNWPGLPPGTDITPFLECAKSDKWQIYWAGIHALSICDCDEARQVVRPFLQREPIRKNEPTYETVLYTLQKIGTPDDIPVLEELTQKATRNIRYCINLAIDAIKQRYQIEKYN